MNIRALSCAVMLAFLTTAPIAGASQTTQLAPIVFSDRTLANGLRVLLVEDHRTPTVAICVGFRVGGKDDPASRSGFAHLFEHLMFKGTPNTKSEALDRLTEDVGGFNNAYTAEDITNYYEVVPSNYLEPLLWAEADRMKALNIDEANFTTERKVVIGEYEQSYVANPYGRLEILTDSAAYTTHPYKRGVIGVPAELNAATLDDVRHFHETYYRPDNAVLVLSGDFESASANRWIDAYFGALTKPAGAIPRVTVVEPAQTAERRLTDGVPGVPLPAVRYVYHAVAAGAPDAAALDVLATVLSTGTSSRLYTTLVYEKQVANQATAEADLRAQPGLFVIDAIAANGKTPADLEPLLDAEIARVQTELIAPDELARAKTQLFARRARGRETNDQVAQALVRAAVIDGDPQAVNREAVDLVAVSAADVRRVAATYLRVINRTVIEYSATTGAAK